MTDDEVRAAAQLDFDTEILKIDAQKSQTISYLLNASFAMKLHHKLE